MRTRFAVTALSAALVVALAACSKQEQNAPMADRADATAAAEAAAAAPAAPAADAAAVPPAAEKRAGMPEAAMAVARDESEHAGGANDAGTIETDTRVDPSQLTSSANSYRDAQRKFIRTAKSEFRVKDVYSSAMAIEDAAAEQGGFVINNHINAQTDDVRRVAAGDGKLVELAEYTMRGTMTVRVPSDRTQAFLRAIAAQMEFLDDRDFQANDVQLQILRQQLAWQRQQVVQQSLGQVAADDGRTDRRADVVVQRGEAIEQRDESLLQQKDFEDKVEFSTIELSLYQLPKVRRTEMTDVDALFRQNRAGFFPRLGESLMVGWNGVLDLVVALSAIWPLLLAGAAGLWAWRRWSAKHPRRTPPEL